MKIEYKKYSTLTTLKADIKRYTGNKDNSVWVKLKKFFMNESLWYIISFRIIQKILQYKIPIISILLKIYHKIISVLFGIEISLDAKIGKGFRIWHSGAIFVGPVEIGDNCSISTQVIIGRGGLGLKHGFPRISNSVFIYPGAKIFGDIVIGDNAIIGVNSVVSKDIPDNAVVLGNPGRIIKYVERK